MTITDDNLGNEDIAQETAILDRLGDLGGARDVAVDHDRDTFLAERRAEMEADAPPVIPPCPSWCVSTAAALHPLDFDLVDGLYVRTHEAYSGILVNVEVTERSDGNGGPVTLSEPAIVVYGADYDREQVSPDKMRALASEMTAAASVRDRLATGGCPIWCNGNCDRDEVAGGVMHWSDPSPLPAADDADGFDWEQPEIVAVAGQEKDQPLEEVTFLIRSSEEHFRSAPRARAFAEAILAFVDNITGAFVVDDRGQLADLDGYEPQNR